MEYRKLRIDEIDKINEIDRSEVIEQIYYFKDGELKVEKEYYDVKGFPPGELEEIIKRQYKILNNDGTVCGAFDNEILAGVGSVENKLRGKNKEYMKMDILYVSKDYRGKGIARKILEELKKEGIKSGAKKLYISATPSKSTVDCYINMGSKLIEELDKELFEMEPEDIHLELILEE